MKKVILVAGARPNFMKIAPIIRAMKKHGGFEIILVHTGQHYDKRMSDSFFSTLGIPIPDYNLEVGSGTHAYQTANVMIRFEEVCLKELPDMVLVVGDVNSTIAASLVAKKLHVKLIHVEAGLRSRDINMPEEINRLATDAITDIFFTTEKEASENLINEGHDERKIHFVGHVMIDNLFYQLESLSEENLSKEVVEIKKKISVPYFCFTLHRPSNVDDDDILKKIIHGISSISNMNPVLFPCHPRTREKILKLNISNMQIDSDVSSDTVSSGIILMEPLNYDDFLYFWKDSAGVITDSGGLQEETTALGVPCLTLRDNTERPVTVDVGSNILIGSDMNKLREEVLNILNKTYKIGDVPDLWDGSAAERIAEELG